MFLYEIESVIRVVLRLVIPTRQLPFGAPTLNPATMYFEYPIVAAERYAVVEVKDPWHVHTAANLLSTSSEETY